MRVDALPVSVVVDASVGLKWVIDEPGSETAAALVSGRELATSALFWVEAANVLATKERRGELDHDAADDAWRDLGRAPLKTSALDVEQAGAAFRLAQELRHPAYDCCYLELALARGTALVTGDQRLRRLGDAHPRLAGRIVHLDEIAL